jgi:hypothetical protein
MMRYTAGLGVLMGILAGFCGRPALADDDDPFCATVTIEADAPVDARWPRLLNDLREAFAARDDIDRCARVELAVRGADIIVEVVLPDGRSAARPVSRREDVIPVLEALLLVPQRVAQAETPALEPPGSRSSPASAPSPPPSAAFHPGAREIPPVRVLAVPERDAPAPSPAHPSSRLRIELAALAGARIGDGQTAVGLGACSFLDLSGWLVGFEGRADRYTTLSGASPDATVLELAVLGGRRFRFQSASLDLVAGPAAVLQGTTTFESKAAPAQEGDVSGSSSSTAPRLLLGGRVNFGARSALRSFVGVDGELGPPRAGDGDSLPNAPRLPVWTLGLALGATVGTR